ncbi:MAG: hypothetical protein GY765_37485, partial [bacterium]|nr:hypothetical protein [bacterium]
PVRYGSDYADGLATPVRYGSDYADGLATPARYGSDYADGLATAARCGSDYPDQPATDATGDICSGSDMRMHPNGWTVTTSEYSVTDANDGATIHCTIISGSTGTITIRNSFSITKPKPIVRRRFFLSHLFVRGRSATSIRAWVNILFNSLTRLRTSLIFALLHLLVLPTCIAFALRNLASQHLGITLLRQEPAPFTGTIRSGRPAQTLRPIRGPPLLTALPNLRPAA